MSKTWTTTADFDTWFKLNVTDAAVADQLQLLPPTGPGPMPIARFVYNPDWPTFDHGVLVYVDSNTGAILGKYRTLPQNSGNAVRSNPQIVWTDLYGNSWVSDDMATTPPFPSPTGGSITKVGVIIGGTRCDASGVPNANGLYLKPPFLYNSGVADRDGDGLIRTFNPASETTDLPWVNVTDLAGGADAHTQDCVDDAILLFQRTTGAGTNGVCTQTSGEQVWVGTVDEFAE